MLDIASKYTDKLKLLFADITFDDKYKYLSGSSYRDEYSSSNSTWSKHEFVSIHNGDILGYLSYNIDRDANIANGMQIVNFKNPSVIFSRDLYQFITDVFNKFKFRKLAFCVIVGNPIEKSYDKMIFKYGGRIVGTKLKECKLIDGRYYDFKMYEISLEDYIKNKDKRKGE